MGAVLSKWPAAASRQRATPLTPASPPKSSTPGTPRSPRSMSGATLASERPSMPGAALAPGGLNVSTATSMSEEPSTSKDESGSQRLSLSLPGDRAAKTYRVRLGERMIHDDEKVRRRLNLSESDLTLYATEKQEFKIKPTVVETMSLYLERAIKRDSKLLASRGFKVNCSHQALEVLVDYFKTGNVTLSADNVEEVYEAADFLLVDTMKITCREYLMDRMEKFPYIRIISFRLALKYLDAELQAVADRAASIFAENLESDENAIMALPGEMFAVVIKQDRLRVSTEYDVVKLIHKWIERKQPSQREILGVLECVRLPHLTRAEFKELLLSFPFANGLNSVMVVRDSRIEDMPDELLARRDFYDIHLHLLWDNKANDVFELKCHRSSQVRGGPEQQTTLEKRFIDKGQLQWEHRDGDFQFLTVMNTTFAVTFTSDKTKIEILRRNVDPEGVVTWPQHCLVSDDTIDKPSDFRATSFKNSIILVVTTEANGKLQKSLVEVDIGSETSIKVYPFINEIIAEMPFELRQIGFYEDYIVLMGDKHFARIKRKGWHVQNSRTDGDEGALEKYYGFVRLNEQLFTFVTMRDEPGVSLCMRGVFGELKLHGESYLNTDLRKFRDDPGTRWTSYESCSTIIIGARNNVKNIYEIAQYDIIQNKCRGRFLTRSFNNTEEENKKGIPFLKTKKKPDLCNLVQPLPIYVNQCLPKTILHEHCGLLESGVAHDKLKRLAYYL